MMYVARRPEDGSIYLAEKAPFVARIAGQPVKLEQVRDNDKELLAFLEQSEQPSMIEQLKARVAELEAKVK
jgi:hypothetical protein